MQDLCDVTSTKKHSTTRRTLWPMKVTLELTVDVATNNLSSQVITEIALHGCLLQSGHI